MDRIGIRFNVRVSENLINSIEGVARKEEETLSDIARRTIRTGLAIKIAANQGQIFLKRDQSPPVRIIFLTDLDKI